MRTIRVAMVLFVFPSVVVAAAIAIDLAIALVCVLLLSQWQHFGVRMQQGLQLHLGFFSLPVSLGQLRQGCFCLPQNLYEVGSTKDGMVVRQFGSDCYPRPRIPCGVGDLVVAQRESGPVALAIVPFLGQIDVQNRLAETLESRFVVNQRFEPGPAAATTIAATAALFLGGGMGGHVRGRDPECFAVVVRRMLLVLIVVVVSFADRLLLHRNVIVVGKMFLLWQNHAPQIESRLGPQRGRSVLIGIVVVGIVTSVVGADAVALTFRSPFLTNGIASAQYCWVSVLVITTVIITGTSTTTATAIAIRIRPFLTLRSPQFVQQYQVFIDAAPRLDKRRIFQHRFQYFRTGIAVPRMGFGWRSISSSSSSSTNTANANSAIHIHIHIRIHQMHHQTGVRSR
mmetsp:Transcript_1693/g.3786  ORF Transcript_1693/g.3786 Transcript_1693/m.3786 type:complete len:398 (+) Transcript_1693:813-2006(+)